MARSRRLRKTQILAWQGWRPDKMQAELRMYVGHRVWIRYVQERAERHALPPVEGVLVKVYRHGFLVEGRCREFVSFSDVYGGLAQLEVTC